MENKDEFMELLSMIDQMEQKAKNTHFDNIVTEIINLRNKLISSYYDFNGNE